MIMGYLEWKVGDYLGDFWNILGGGYGGLVYDNDSGDGEK